MKSIIKDLSSHYTPLLLLPRPHRTPFVIPRSTTELSSRFPSHLQRPHSDRQARIHSLLISQHSTTGKSQPRYSFKKMTFNAMDTHTCRYSRYSGEGSAIVTATRIVTPSSDCFLLSSLSSWSWSCLDDDCMRFRHDNGVRLDIVVCRELLSGCCWPSSATGERTSLCRDRG